MSSMATGHLTLHYGTHGEAADTLPLFPPFGCRKYGSWDFDFQNLNVINETADLTLPIGGLG